MRAGKLQFVYFKHVQPILLAVPGDKWLLHCSTVS